VLKLPLSKCKHCGKKIPNPFHKFHEEKQCLEMRRKKGEFLHKVLPHVEKPKPKINHNLLDFMEK